MVFHFGSSPEFMPRSPFDTMIHTMPFNTGVFAAELLWSPVLRKFPDVKFSLAEGGIGWIPYWLERADYTYRAAPPLDRSGLRRPATQSGVQGSGPHLLYRRLHRAAPALRHRGREHRMGVRLPPLGLHVAQRPEAAWKSFQAAQVPDDEIHKITWENACRFYSFDPLAHRSRERCTVGAVVTEAIDVDVTPQSFGNQGRFGPTQGRAAELNADHSRPGCGPLSGVTAGSTLANSSRWTSPR